MRRHVDDAADADACAMLDMSPLPMSLIVATRLSDIIDDYLRHAIDATRSAAPMS